MTDTVRHRGPDDAGLAVVRGPDWQKYWTQDTAIPSRSEAAGGEFRDEHARGADVLLGHRRLSILDLSPLGHQPMGLAGSVMVFNGEIYNFQELRLELQALGRELRSGSDTEVLQHAVDAWGWEALDRLNGMFAFVHVDVRSGLVTLVRDRFGVKPLYYWRSPEGFLAIASEIKQFTVLPGWSPRVDREAAYDFLVWSLADHGVQTMFDSVRQLEPGHLGIVDLRSPERELVTRRWYRPRTSVFEGSFEDASTGLAHLLEDAVRLRLRADVAVGTGLSGGLDSSSIVCLAHAALVPESSDQNTFTACSGDEATDERRWAEIVIAATGSRAHFVSPDPARLMAEIPTLTWHQDEPFASTSIYAEWCVFRSVREGRVTVTLDGHGADELLGGYPEFLAPHLVAVFRDHGSLAFLHEFRGASRARGPGMVAAMLAHRILPESLRQSILSTLGRSSHRPDWIDARHLDRERRSPFAEAGLDRATVPEMRQVLFDRTSLPAQMHWCDRDSMAHSVESRAPFLDYRVVEFVQSLPPEFLIQGGLSKSVLRRAMAGVLPEPIRTRRDKIGFEMPEQRWMTSTTRDWVMEHVRHVVHSSEGFLKEHLIDVVESMLSGTRSFDRLAWRLVSYGIWKQQFTVEGPN